MSTTVSNNMIAFDGGHFAFRNKLINGDMDIWQRGTTFTVSASSVYTADRWVMYTDTLRPGRGNITQSSDVPSNSEFQTSLQFQVTTVSNANNQPLSFRQIIEGYNARDLIGQTFNISFWVKSSKTGTYSVCLGNAGNGTVSDRSYVTEYTIDTNNWEKKTIVVPGGLITAGNWNWTDGRGLEVIFGMAGQGTSTPLNTWVTGDIETAPNQVNLLDVVGNSFNITGVQLERGVASTPFEHRPIGTEWSLCGRYYEFGFDYNSRIATNALTYEKYIDFKIIKRAKPVMTPAPGSTVLINTGGSSGVSPTLGPINSNVVGWWFQFASTSTSFIDCAPYAYWAADAEL